MKQGISEREMARLYWKPNRYTQVSDIDLHFLSQFCWNEDIKGYLITRSGEVPENRLHRLVAFRAGMCMFDQIDHINRNNNDNRRKNLRSATNGMNRANSKLNSNNSSGYKGVHRKKRRAISSLSRRVYSNRGKNDKWVAQINFQGKKIHIGCFDSPDEAHKAYSHAASVYFGEFAHPVSRKRP